MAALRWIGKVAGGFAAAFLAYVVCGSFIGLVATGALAGRGGVCPTDWFGGIGARCEDPLAWAFWYAVADLPSVILLRPVGTALLFMGPRPGETLFLEGDVLFSSILIVGLSVAGFFAWLPRARLVAWLLAAAFVAEVAFVISLY